jgi:hypothetical protein
MEMLRITRGRAAVKLPRPHLAMTRANIINGVVLTASLALCVILSIRYFGWPMALLAGPVMFGAGWLMAAIWSGDWPRTSK